MQTTVTSRLAFARPSCGPFQAGGAALRVSKGRKNVHFIDMMVAFRGFGGILRSPQIDEHVRLHRRSIDSDDLGGASEDYRIEFEWDESHWLPLFQFEHDCARISPRVLAAARALPGTFTGWDVAVWFATPNRWLDQQRPVFLLASECDRVCAAAGLGSALC